MAFRGLVKHYMGPGALTWICFTGLTLVMAYLLEIHFQKRVAMPLLIKKRKKAAVAMPVISANAS
ncbi:hypothetical protein [[Flexibacter] sp. ATCC 35208]|uniref:hypothetical protein n=1 Tax=[Flexibacter] sp. ATCC 35208 TaxID=1936242 RepID=UPI00117F1E0A|nr:hypothetical protein [[Flexibacter] sp. ATCC 35208]